MNKETNKAVSRETLVKASEVCKEAFHPVLESVKAAEKAILERAVAGCGEIEVRVLSYEGFEIAIPDEKQPRWYRTELHYRKDGWREEDPRRLTMSVAGYGSFGAGDASMVRLMTVVGRLAERLSDIKMELALLDWATFDDLRLACQRSYDAIHEFDREAEEARIEAEKAEARKALVAGAVIEADSRFGSHRDRFLIEKVTASRVFYYALYEDGTPVHVKSSKKLEYVIANIQRGDWVVVPAEKVVAA